MVRFHLAMGVAIFACRLLDSFTQTRTMAAVGETFRADERVDTGELRLKLGALFDIRSRHLTQTFQAAVKNHNSPAADQTSVKEHTDAVIVLEPVIAYVDVSDSFAVSNAMCSLMAHDIIAIVGITNASSLATIQSYSATFHVPFISLGSSQNLSSVAPFQLLMRPPLMAAVVDLLSHHDCTSALYVYDSDEGLMRIQDLFQAINVREVVLELDVRRVGDKSHVTEMLSVIRSLHVERDVCVLLDLEYVDPVTAVAILAASQANVKDIILVTMDVLPILHTLTATSGWERRPCNVSGFQLLPSEPDTVTQRTYHSAHSFASSPATETHDVKVTRSAGHLPSGQGMHSARGLIADTLLVLHSALMDVLEADGNIFVNVQRGDSDMQQRYERSMKCTSFVVDKKEHGDTFMEALRVVHVYGETGHVSFDPSGKRENFSFSVFSIKSGSIAPMKVGLWSSVTGLSSTAHEQESTPTYIIFGNVTPSSLKYVEKKNIL